MDNQRNRISDASSTQSSGYSQRRTVPLRGSRGINIQTEFSALHNSTGSPRPPARVQNTKPPQPQKRRLSPEEIKQRRKKQRQREIELRARAQIKKRNRLIALALLALFIVVFIVTKLVISLDSNEKREKYEIAKKKTEAVTAAAAEPEIEQSAVPYSTDDGAAVSYPTDDGTAVELNIDSEYGILISLSDNRVVAAKKGTEKIYPASMTKIMTLIVAVENVADIENTTFTFDAEMLSEFLKDNASVAGFKAGETVTVKDMLYGLILPSGADAAAGIAKCVSGSEEAFVNLMNETAVRIGLANTHFTNPIGLHNDDLYSTCMDMAVLLEYAIHNPVCLEVLSTYQYTTAHTEQNSAGIALTSTLFSRMEGGEPESARVYAGKTGYTIEGSNCLASYAKSNLTGDGYILVTAKGSSIWKPIFDAINTYKEFVK